MKRPNKELVLKYQRQVQLKKSWTVLIELDARRMKFGGSAGFYTSAIYKIRDKLENISFTSEESRELEEYDAWFYKMWAKCKKDLEMENPYPWHIERWCQETGNSFPVGLLQLYGEYDRKSGNNL